MDILIGRVTGEKPTPGETFGSRGHHVILAWEGLIPDHWDQEGNADFPGLLPWVFYLRDGSKLCPPVWCLTGRPTNPATFHSS